MPPRNITAIANFKYVGDDEPGGGSTPPTSKYKVTLNKQGNGSGNIIIRYNGETLEQSVTESFNCLVCEISEIVDMTKLEFELNNSNSTCTWSQSGSTSISNNAYYEVTVNGSDMIITVTLNKSTNRVDPSLLRAFKIVSVRDLNWMNHFVENGKLHTNKFFAIPVGNTTMLQNAGNYVQPIKMGYAVEFELITTGIA